MDVLRQRRYTRIAQLICRHVKEYVNARRDSAQRSIGRVDADGFTVIKESLSGREAECGHDLEILRGEFR